MKNLVKFRVNPRPVGRGYILNEKLSSPFLHLFGAFLMRFFGAQAFSTLSLILSI
jgi:hypothetical protein